MEKYARQAVSEGVKNAEDLHVGADSEIYRVLNLHYNRNNHIEVWGPQVRILANHTHQITLHIASFFCFNFLKNPLDVAKNIFNVAFSFFFTN